MKPSDNDNFALHFGPWPNTKALARELGSLRYYTGIPCIRGHLSPRLASAGSCYDCSKLHREENREKIAADYRDWYQENKEKQIAYNTAWRAENKEHMNAENNRRSALYRAAYADRFAARTREYYRRKMEDPEFRALCSFRSKENRARRMGADGTFSQDDVASILASQGAKCAICEKDISEKYSIDHIHPLSRGGSNWPENLQMLCGRCNASKGAKTMDEFFAMMALRPANDNTTTRKAA